MRADVPPRAPRRRRDPAPVPHAPVPLLRALVSHCAPSLVPLRPSQPQPLPKVAARHQRPHGGLGPTLPRLPERHPHLARGCRLPESLAQPTQSYSLYRQRLRHALPFHPTPARRESPKVYGRPKSVWSKCMVDPRSPRHQNVSESAAALPQGGLGAVPEDRPARTAACQRSHDALLRSHSMLRPHFHQRWKYWRRCCCWNDSSGVVDGAATDP